MCKRAVSNSKAKQKLSDTQILFDGKVNIRDLLTLEEDFSSKKPDGKEKGEISDINLA